MDNLNLCTTMHSTSTSKNGSYPRIFCPKLNFKPLEIGNRKNHHRSLVFVKVISPMYAYFWKYKTFAFLENAGFYNSRAVQLENSVFSHLDSVVYRV